MSTTDASSALEDAAGLRVLRWPHLQRTGVVDALVSFAAIARLRP